MPLFEKHINFLKLLISTTPRQKKALIKTSDPSQRLSIIELVLNFLKGSFSLQEDITKEFYKHRKILRALSLKSSKHRVELFVKNINIISLLLKAVLEYLV